MPKWVDATAKDFDPRKVLRPREGLAELEPLRSKVRRIVKAIRDEGDQALNRFRKRFDFPRASPQNLWVTESEIESAYEEAGKGFVNLVRKTLRRIHEHHLRQLEGLKRLKWGGVAGLTFSPLRRAGVYVPGGRFPYPSTALMTVVPAKVAGVDEIIVATPPDKEGRIPAVTLVALHEAGASRILRAGGAHAVAALAFGTESVPKVDKIVGPGGAFVTLAKLEVCGAVGIDMLAGPSEVAVVADGTFPPRYAAADLLAQAEHDPLARAWLITPRKSFARKVERAGRDLLKRLPQELSRAWEKQVTFVICRDLEHATELADALAPEHLELQVENPRLLLRRLRSACAVFVGPFSPAVVGDYVAGPSHVLPTGGAAVHRSPLGVWDFVKFVSIVNFEEKRFKREAPLAVEWAEREGMLAHKLALEVRLEE